MFGRFLKSPKPTFFGIGLAEYGSDQSRIATTFVAQPTTLRRHSRALPGLDVGNSPAKWAWLFCNQHGWESRVISKSKTSRSRAPGVAGWRFSVSSARSMMLYWK